MSRIRADKFVNNAATGAPQLSFGAEIPVGYGLTGAGGINVGGAATISGNLTVGGVLTYEDVTNIDSIGIITARSDVSIAEKIIHTGDTDTAIRFPAANTFVVDTAGTERLRVLADGTVSAGTTTATPGTIAAGSIICTNTNAGIFVRNGGDASFGSADNNNVIFRVNGSEKVRIATSGQIGLGGANYGTSGQVITSNGSGSAPTWQNAGGITMAQQWRLTSDSTGNVTPLTAWEAIDTYGQGSLGSAMTASSGVFTYPSTGIYLVLFNLVGYSDNHSQNIIGQIQHTTNNSTYNDVAIGHQGIYDFNNSYPSWATTSAMYMFDITDTTNHKTRFTFGAGQGNESVKGSTSISYTTATFIRLGDT